MKRRLCDCSHPKGWHRQGVGSCLECGCLEFLKPGTAPPGVHQILPEYFITEDGGQVWKLWCKGCELGWSFPKSSPLKIGNQLHLLNHARGHKAKAVTS